MYATALEKYGKKKEIATKQNILIDLMKIKFGSSPSDEKKIVSPINPGKLDKALQKFVTAKTREEVLKCLD